MARCEVCFRHCELQEGQTGPCGARTASGGCVRPVFYGRVSSLALDPIEKKRLLGICAGYGPARSRAGNAQRAGDERLR